MKYFVVMFGVLLSIHSAPSFAGLIATELTQLEKTPACLDVFAGGVTGPGTGVTIQNNCDHDISIQRVTSGSLPVMQSRQEDVDVYLSNEKGAYRNVRFSTKGGDACRFSKLPPEEKPETSGEACGTLDTAPCAPDHFKKPQEIQCSTVILGKKDAALFFVDEYFVFQGEQGVTVSGRLIHQ